MNAAHVKFESPVAHTASTVADCRCACGNLLARLTRDGVELKCRRCKRILLVPVPLAQGATTDAPLFVLSVSGDDPR